jgi:hypothetical protein
MSIVELNLPTGFDNIDGSMQPSVRCGENAAAGDKLAGGMSAEGVAMSTQSMQLKQSLFPHFRADIELGAGLVHNMHVP